MAKPRPTDAVSSPRTSRLSTSLGNVQSPVASSQFTFDSAAPDPPALTGISDDTGVAGDLLTSDRTLVFAGEAEPGVTVDVMIDGGLAGTVTSDAAGDWVLDYSAVELAEGEHAITTTARDVAGNQGDVSAPYTVEIDTASPNVTFTGPAVDSQVNGTARFAFTDVARVAAPAVAGIGEVTVCRYPDELARFGLLREPPLACPISPRRIQVAVRRHLDSNARTVALAVAAIALPIVARTI